MGKRLLAYQMLILPVFLGSFGCRPLERKDVVNKPITLNDIRVDIEVDADTSVTLVYPSARDPKDGKFHYKVTSRRGSDRVEVASDGKVIHRGGSVRIMTAAEPPKPAPPVKTAFRWEEKFGKPAEDCDQVVDLSKMETGDPLVNVIEGACDISGNIQCWSRNGIVNADLTAQVANWKEKFPFDVIERKKLNKLVVVNHPAKGNWGYNSSDLPFDWQRFEKQPVGSRDYLMFGVDEPVIEMPLYLWQQQTLSRSPQFTLTDSKSAQVGRYTIETSAEIDKVIVGSVVKVLKFSPALSPADSVVATFEDGGISSAGGDIHSQHVGIMPGLPPDDADWKSAMKNPRDKMKPVKYQLVYGSSKHILWKYLPLRPKPKS